MNEWGSQCTYEGKGAVSGGKEKKRKKDKLGGKGAARADSRKRETPFASERGPLCTCEKRGMVRRKEKKKKKPHHSTCVALDWWGGEEPEKWQDAIRPCRVTSK